jgi:LysM repeat protein
MRARRWVLFIGLNIIVSVLTTLGVLSLRGELERIVVVTATPGIEVAESVPTAVPVDQSPATEPALSPTPSESIEYTIQEGDTLGGIALAFDVPLEDLLLANNLTEDDIINPGRTLVIPVGEVVTPTPVTPSPVPETPTPVTPTPFPTETPTPPGPVEVRVQKVLAPGELDREGVVIVNRGRTVNLQGWTLGAAGTDSTYIFPRLTLAQEVPVTVYTIAGDDSPLALHWGLEVAQWSESGTVIELRDAEGDLIATYTVP